MWFMRRRRLLEELEKSRNHHHVDKELARVWELKASKLEKELKSLKTILKERKPTTEKKGTRCLKIIHKKK